MAARLKETYKSEVAPALMKKFGYKSVMQIPKLDKIVINVGCGEARENSKVVDAIISDLSQITGQRPVVCRAKKSVANFKLREGMPIGVRSLCVARECMNSWTDSLIWLSPECVTLEGSMQTPLTAVVTTPWVSKNS